MFRRMRWCKVLDMFHSRPERKPDKPRRLPQGAVRLMAPESAWQFWIQALTSITNSSQPRGAALGSSQVSISLERIAPTTRSDTARLWLRQRLVVQEPELHIQELRPESR